MSSKVVPISRAPKQIAHYLRLGQGCHKQLEDLHDAGDLPFGRIIADASRLNEQSDLIKTLLNNGKELVLDPNMAELSTIGGCAGQARHLAWAKKEGEFWRPEDMNEATLKSIVAEIAQTAVETGCNAIQSPSHLLQGATDPWLPIDIKAAQLLRLALDEAGYSNISLDYVLCVKYASLRDTEARRLIIEHLANAPFENLWLRIPGFGANSTGAMVRQYISAVNDILRELGHPSIIADCAGGLPALAVCAFGSVAGIAHGVAEKEEFNPSPWVRPRQPKKFGGRARRIYVPTLDSYLSEKEFQQLWGMQGARSKLVCHDPSCCARGKANMQDKRHVLYQRAKQVNDLSRVPELSRPEYLLHRQIEPVGQDTRTLERLKALDKAPDIRRKLARRSAKIDRLSRQLRELVELRGLLEQSPNPRHRGHRASTSSRS